MKATFNVSNTWMFSSNFWRLRIYGLHTFIRPNYHREMHFKAPEAFLTCPVLHIFTSYKETQIQGIDFF